MQLLRIVNSPEVERMTAVEVERMAAVEAAAAGGSSTAKDWRHRVAQDSCRQEVRVRNFQRVADTDLMSFSKVFFKKKKKSVWG